MLYTELTKKAMLWAYHVHKDARTDSGYPVFAHCVLVAERMQSEAGTVTALLHELIADHSIEEVAACGFPTEVIEALQLLVYRYDMPYERYQRLLKVNDIAKNVKIADLKQELDIMRQPGLAAEDRKRFEERMELLEFLLDEEVSTADEARLTGLSAHIDDKIRDKIRGVFFGMAVGESLGRITYYFSPQSIEKLFPDGPYLQTTCEGYAQVGDGSIITAYTAAALLSWETSRYIEASECDPIERIHSVLANDFMALQGYFRQSYTWLSEELDETFRERSYGEATVATLRAKKRGSVYAPVNNEDNADGLVRALAVATYFKDQAARVDICRIAVECAALTDGHPCGFLPAGILAFIVNYILYEDCGAETPLSEIIEDSKALLYDVYGTAFPVELMQIYAALDDAIKRSGNDRTDKENMTAIGDKTAMEVLAGAVYCNCKYSDFKQKITCAAMHTAYGDSEAAGAVTGGIAGAHVGAKRIPATLMIDLDLRDVLLAVADDVCDGPRTIDEDWKKRYVYYGRDD